jgi:hypothetical protein
MRAIAQIVAAPTLSMLKQPLGGVFRPAEDNLDGELPLVSDGAVEPAVDHDRLSGDEPGAL